MSTSTLSEIVEAWGGLIQTGPFGSQLHQHDYSEQGIPVVMPKDIRNGRVDESGIARIPEDKASQLSRHFLKAGSVVFPRRGEISKCAYINEEQAGFLCGTGCIKIEPPEEKLRSKFLFYFLGLRQSVEWLERNAVGTTMLNLNTKILGGLKVPLLAPKKQDEIVDILSAYDDLIENNRRRIQLLEQAARLLYKEWFVHLSFPGHEHTRIIDGVPEGWEDTFLPDVIDVNPKTPVEKGKEILYVPMSALSEAGMTADTGDFERRITHTAVKFKKNDVLLARITPCLENGKTGYVYFLGDDEVACGSTEFIVLRGRRVSPAFAYCLARSYPFRGNAIKSMIGSSGRQRVQVSCFDEYKVPLPPKHLLEMFDDIANTTFDQIRVLVVQNDKLAKARDLFLPKLMNGEVVV